MLFRVGWFVASPVGAPFMTPGAGTAHVVGRVACRWMRAGRRLVCRFVADVCGISSVIRASQVAPLRLWVVECCFAAVIRASQVAPLRLRAVDCCFAGGCWRRNEGLSGEGDGYEKKKPDRRCCVCLASCGCGGSTRTNDLQVMSLASYQLLHSAMCSLIRVQK